MNYVFGIGKFFLHVFTILKIFLTDIKFFKIVDTLNVGYAPAPNTLQAVASRAQLQDRSVSVRVTNERP